MNPIMRRLLNLLPRFMIQFQKVFSKKKILDYIIKEFAPNVGVPKGPLNEFLRKEWARGKLTTPQIQQIALKAMQQGAPGMERMAAMGGSGKHPQNLYRAMKHLLGWPKGAAPVSFIEIPTVRGAKTPPSSFLVS